MKKFLMMVWAATLAALSHGYTLMWDVDVGSNDDFKYAYLVAVNDSDSSRMFIGGGHEIGSGGTFTEGLAFDELLDMTAYDNNTGTWDTGNQAPVDWSGYSFHVLFTDENKNQVFATDWTGRDQSVFPSAVPWADLIDFTDVPGSMMNTWVVVPEPSCALLFGLGAALVAFRRRRRA